VSEYLSEDPDRSGHESVRETKFDIEDHKAAHLGRMCHVRYQNSSTT
jgi:hypothetical protein